MRLDKYLKVSRIIKRRTLAKEAVDKGLVLINGKTAKASSPVKIGDVLTVNYKDKKEEFEILEIFEYATEEKAEKMYKKLG